MASRPKAFVGFLHAGEGSRAALDAVLARYGKQSDVVHLVDPTLVDASASEFPIDEKRYRAIRARAEQLAREAERIVLSCSVYNGVAGWLSEDLGIPVERSDAAGVRALLDTQGPIGVLISYPPTRPVVVDYISEVLAGAEQSREIRASLAQDAPPFATSADRYARALLDAMRPLADCGALFVSQYTMNAHLDALRAAWAGKPLISAVEATADALFG